MGFVNYKIAVIPPPLKPGGQVNVDAVESMLVEMGLVVERTVKEKTPLGATKLLRGSIFSEPRGKPVREVLVGSPLVYAPIVERGRQPGKFPPSGPLQLWVRRVLGIENPKQVKAVAYVIARKIAKQGTRALANQDVGHMFERALKKAAPVIRAIAEKVGARIAVDFGKGQT